MRINGLLVEVPRFLAAVAWTPASFHGSEPPSIKARRSYSISKAPYLLTRSTLDGLVMPKACLQMLEVYGRSISREMTGRMFLGVPLPVCRYPHLLHSQLRREFAAYNSAKTDLLVAILPGPCSPALVGIILLVKGLIVGVQALLSSLALAGAGLQGALVEPTDKVEQLG